MLHDTGKARVRTCARQAWKSVIEQASMLQHMRFWKPFSCPSIFSGSVRSSGLGGISPHW